MMREPQTEDSVELVRDVANKSLHLGDTGVVCSIWFMPNPMYEVDFEPADEHVHVRALLGSDSIRVVERPALKREG